MVHASGAVVASEGVDTVKSDLRLGQHAVNVGYACSPCPSRLRPGSLLIIVSASWRHVLRAHAHYSLPWVPWSIVHLGSSSIRTDADKTDEDGALFQPTTALVHSRNPPFSVSKHMSTTNL